MNQTNHVCTQIRWRTLNAHRLLLRILSWPCIFLPWPVLSPNRLSSPLPHTQSCSIYSCLEQTHPAEKWRPMWPDLKANAQPVCQPGQLLNPRMSAKLFSCAIILHHILLRQTSPTFCVSPWLWPTSHTHISHSFLFPLWNFPPILWTQNDSVHRALQRGGKWPPTVVPSSLTRVLCGASQLKLVLKVISEHTDGLCLEFKAIYIHFIFRGAFTLIIASNH